VSNINLYWSLVSAAGMMLVAIVAVLSWQAFTSLRYRWFCVGAALWFAAMAVKEAIVPIDAVVFPRVVRSVPPAVLTGGLYVGLECAVCEIGLTLLAVLIWPQLGRDAERAIGIGVGAGAFEACFLAAFAAAPIIGALVGWFDSESVRTRVDRASQLTTAFWLVPSVERIIAILGHAATRALVLLGATRRRPWMIFWAFAIFAAGDAIVTAVHMLGIVDQRSMWWLELAYFPLAVVSIPVIYWCYSQYRSSVPAETTNRLLVSIT
jgi:hypothetical protein